MSVDKSNAYKPKTRGWFDEPDAAPVAPTLDRETLKRKTQEAAASVGYQAPSEVALAPVTAVAPAVMVEKAVRVAKAKVAKVEPEPKGKGRPRGDRTVQMSVRIREDHDLLIKSIAGDDFTVASIVETALVAFAKTLVVEKKYKRMPLDEKTLEIARQAAQ
ncbi:hypothetical protein ATDW_36330 (plasmid) [Asticcacaulis sp. DW145]|uniref:hypothetical protein n=1 Tax=Asticcacaulis sp. DW145 TaxID=3095608 RepID=UPI00308542F7|nr:hypothetical protein ATDW_36330 [Asticcacaulis sp. DW145]